ncbi:MAG: cupin domain-containing protein [Sporichthyaceae bacterium]
MNRLIRRSTVAASALLLATLPGPAGASPPSGFATFDDVGRGRLAADRSVVAAPRTGVVVGEYTLAPAADDGWRRLPGSTILAVAGGILTVRSARTCAATDYPAGTSAVLEVGDHLFANAGPEPVRFGGVLLGLAGSARPTIDRLPTTATRCGRQAGTALTVDRQGAATFVDTAGYHDHHGEHGRVGHLFARGGRDIGIQFVRVAAGTSIGWHSHPGPALILIQRGTIDYYTDRDGACVNVGHYSGGDAYVVAPSPGHRHIGYISEGGEGFLVYLDLPGTFAAVPSLGMTLDGNDFTPTPPPGCPTLRDNRL